MTIAPTVQEPAAAMTATEFRAVATRIQNAVQTAMVGQQELILDVLTGIVSGGHILLEGAPGLGKTMLVRAFASALDLEFSRIQFTPDLMPADITGTNILAEDSEGRRRFVFQPGPVFANLVLADEINRATPKSQSALLEAMQEKTVTIANVARSLEQPFFVLATQNPLEMEGTYPLPEAQLDRFFFKLLAPFPDAADLTEIVRRTTSTNPPEIAPAADGATMLRMGELARQTPIANGVMDYVVRIVLATHPAESAIDEVRRYTQYGVSPRGAQAIVLAGKVRALIDSRFNVAYDDVRAAVLPALRHRLMLNFDAAANGVTTDDVLRAVLAAIPESA